MGASGRLLQQEGPCCACLVSCVAPQQCSPQVTRVVPWALALICAGALVGPVAPLCVKTRDFVKLGMPACTALYAGSLAGPVAALAASGHIRSSSTPPPPPSSVPAAGGASVSRRTTADDQGIAQVSA